MEYDRHRLCPENEVHRAPYCVNTGVVSVSLSNEKTSGCTIILLSSPRSAVSFITHEADQIPQLHFFFFWTTGFFPPAGRRVRRVGVFRAYLEDDELACWC